MSRWRAPQPRSSPHITASGFRALEAELKALWQRRSGVVQALSAAAAEGDRSENAEYIYRKKELAGLDRRIHYLQKRLPDLQVVREVPTTGSQVYFGAWVRLAAADGAGVEYRIVGADETDGPRSCISIDSPLARALLGKRVDDEVELALASGSHRYRVTAIRYERSD